MSIFDDKVIRCSIRYKWGFYKTLEFLDSRRPDLEIRRNFFDQLKCLAERISENETISNTWDEIASTDPEIRNEEAIIRNTFFNSKMEDNESNNQSLLKKKGGKSKKKKLEKRKRKIKWVDEVSKNKTVETEVYPVPTRQLKLNYNPNFKSEKSILKSDSKNQSQLSYANQNLAFSLADNNRPRSRGEPLSAHSEKNTTNLSSNFENNDSNNPINLEGNAKGRQQVPRPNSLIYNNTISNSRDRSHRNDNNSDKDRRAIQKRLLNDSLKKSGNSKKKPNHQSNSVKKLDSEKGKRGGTPRRRENSEKEKKRASNSFNRHTEEAATYTAPNNFTKPPTAKKALLVAPEKGKTGFESTLEKYRKEANFILKPDLLSVIMEKRNHIDGGSKKRANKSDLDERDGKNGSFSKNRYFQS